MNLLEIKMGVSNNSIMLASQFMKGIQTMKEIGEQIRSLREAKNMTQQELADRLYVTRQTVSRWECGSRYPDIITVKKLSTILEVSIEELLGTIEIKKDIEKEPVLNSGFDNAFQIVFYTITALAFGLMGILWVYDVLTISGSLANTPAGQISIQSIFVFITHLIKSTISVFGITLSIKRKLSSYIVGVVMSAPYLFDAIFFSVTFIDMSIKKNGYLSSYVWIVDFALPLIFATCILLFFMREIDLLFPLVVIIGMISILECCYGYYHRLLNSTDVGFVVGTIHAIGRLGFIILLEYQAYRLWKKRKIGYK
jgi:transcriptional regulator with XRE-family HTH domain